jgi:hypothetical protein
MTELLILTLSAMAIFVWLLWLRRKSLAARAARHGAARGECVFMKGGRVIAPDE